MSIDDEQYRFVAEEVYKAERESHKVAMQLQGDYGKWLVNALMIINAGAIVGLAQSSTLQKNALHDAGLWFVGGLLAAVACGFISWVNWSINADLHHNLAQPSMKFDIANWPEAGERQAWWINATFYLSIAAGFVSVACIVVGALVARSSLVAP